MIFIGKAMEMIVKYPENPWSWYGISKHPNITMDIIEKYPEKSWDWWSISQNPNITIKFIEKNMENIDFQRLSKNKFTYQNRLNKMFSYWALENTKKRLPQMVNRHIVRTYL